MRGCPRRSRMTDTASQSPSCTCHRSPGWNRRAVDVVRVPDPVLEIDAVPRPERGSVDDGPAGVRGLRAHVAGGCGDSFPSETRPLIQAQSRAAGRQRPRSLLPARPCSSRADRSRRGSRRPRPGGAARRDARRGSGRASRATRRATAARRPRRRQPGTKSQVTTCNLASSASQRTAAVLPAARASGTPSGAPRR